ncbi:hypothetical protein [Helicobacter sp. T3_23-1056]
MRGNPLSHRHCEQNTRLAWQSIVIKYQKHDFYKANNIYCQADFSTPLAMTDFAVSYRANEVDEVSKCLCKNRVM